MTQLKEHLANQPKEKRMVVFIDEMPWLDTPKSDFYAAFEWFWNGWAANQNNLMMIVCGSATTWITEKLLNDKAMNLLEIVGLQDKADERANSLPYGHQRKLEIARAMALDPKLLLLDEPAAGMNADESLELVDFVREIRDHFKITILMIEHHMDVVSNLCDYCTVLNFGKTLAVGTPAEVKSNPDVIRAYLGGNE